MTPPETAAAQPMGTRTGSAPRRVDAPPDGVAEARLALHRLAAYVVSPAVRRVTGDMPLQWTPGGFGTPVFDGTSQVRVAAAELNVQRGTDVVTEPVTSLHRAAELALEGPPDLAWAEGLDVPDPGDMHALLGLDPVPASWLGDWYGFVWSMLEDLRAETADSARHDASPVRLWPEHFDAAFDMGPPDDLATIGGSPGDGGVPEPYLYVLPPASVHREGDLWNAETFPGAILAVTDLLRTGDDPRGAALEFFRERLAVFGG